VTAAVARRWRQPARATVFAGRSAASSPSGKAAVRDDGVPRGRLAPLAALLGTGLVVHAAVAPHLAIRGLAPDVLLVAVVAVAAVRGERAGAGFGFAAGLGADLFLAAPLGTSALAYTLLGHVVGLRENVQRSVLLAYLGVAAGRLGVAVAATALGGLPFPDTAGLLVPAGVAALSAPLGPPTVALVRRLSRPSGARR
jgi:rod shape-determining protein MreD